MAAKKKPAKKAPAKKAGAVERMKKAPREVGPAWELSEQEKARFISAYGLNRVFEQIHPNVHQDDKELLFNGLAAAISFHELSKVINSLYWDDDSDDLRSELEMVRVGFELALRAFDKALDERGIVFDRQKLGGLKRAEQDKRSQCMKEIKETWQSEGRPKAAEFARKIHSKYAETIKNEKSIENAIGRWLREDSSN